MSRTVQFLAAVYPDRKHAYVTLNVLREMQRSDAITLANSVLITRNGDGKIRFEEMTEFSTRKGAWRGAIVTGVFGIAFSSSLFGSVSVGESDGALTGGPSDNGIKTAHIREIANDLRPSEAMVVVLVEDWVATLKAQQALGNDEGTLVAEVFDEETISEIYMQAAIGDRSVAR